MEFFTSALEDIGALSTEEHYRPQPFRLSRTEDRQQMEELLRAADRPRIYDTLLAQLGDLMRTRNPERKLTSEELERLTSEHLAGTTAEAYGVWFYYSWSNRLVHLLDEAEFVFLRTNRNFYKITPEEQARLSRKRVGVVGLSVGHAAALTIALERTCGELRLADFDALELSNLNRIRAGVHNLSVPKVYLTARDIAEVDPYLEVKVFPEGVTSENIITFLLDGGKLDAIVEECDSLDIKIMLRHEARRLAIPVVMATSDRGMLDIERFDIEPERPIFHGLANGFAPEVLRGLTAEEKVPYVVALMELHRLSTRLRASMIEIEQTITTWPQLGSSVTMGGGATADVVRKICLGEPVLSGRYHLDLDQLIAPAAELENPASSKDRLRTGEPTDQEMLQAARSLCLQISKANIKPSPHLVRRFVTDATAAPSGGNAQPWKWLYHDEHLYVFLDRSRSKVPFDPTGFSGVLAIGCAAENLVLSAHAAGWKVRCELLPLANAPELIARFRFFQSEEDDAEIVRRPELYDFITTRRTNRRLGNRQPLQPDDREALSVAVRSVAGSQVYWLEDESQIRLCAELVGQADILQLTDKWLHDFLVKEIRWTPEEARATCDGIGLESLELSPSDKAGFELCRDWSALQIVREVGGGRNLSKISRKAIASASAVGLITANGVTADAFFSAGRAIERMWLTATERHLAIHPMTALPYIMAGNEEQDGVRTGNAITKFRQRVTPPYRRLFPIAEVLSHVFLFRVFRAERTTSASLRRSVDDVLTITSVRGGAN